MQRKTVTVLFCDVTGSTALGESAWMIDHDAASMEGILGVFDGQEGWGLTRDDVLDNITLYWLTNTGISSGRIYRENKLAFFDVKGVSVPVAVSIFPDEVDAAPRSWVEQAYLKLIHYNQLEKGGHFAAWQVPELFVPEAARGSGHCVDLGNAGGAFRTWRAALAPWLFVKVGRQKEGVTHRILARRTPRSRSGRRRSSIGGLQHAGELDRLDTQ